MPSSFLSDILSQAQRDRFIITDNVFSITAELYKTLNLGLEQPPIITVPIPKTLASNSATNILLKKSKILRLQRKIDDKIELISSSNAMKEGDLIMLYLFEGEDSIKEIIDYFQSYDP